MFDRRTALLFLVVVSLCAPSALAQDRTAAVGGFGAMSLQSFAAPSVDFGGNVTKELTPSIHVVGEFGRIGNMLPSITSGLALLTPYDVRVSSYYGEGGVRLLAAPNSGVNPYVEATAGIARLTPRVSGLGSLGVITFAGLTLLGATDPMLGFGGGVLLRGGPVVADLGYRYKQIAGGDSFAALLGAGQPLHAHQLRFGFGVRF
jgi:hypothetical protein